MEDLYTHMDLAIKLKLKKLKSLLSILIYVQEIWFDGIRDKYYVIGK